MDRYTYSVGESFFASVKIANYGKKDICGILVYELNDENGQNLAKGTVHTSTNFFFAGELTEAETIELKLNGIEKACKLEIKVNLIDEDAACSDISCKYPLWVYPNVEPVCPDQVYETEVFDEKAEKVLNEGGIVYLTPPSTKEALPHSVKPQFSTDFWSVGTFPNQEGTMGQLIDKEHPLFKDFPTEFYSTWQWYPMATQRAFILPDYRKTIITEMDSFAYLRSMSQCFEANCRNGKILVSSMGLQHLQQYPEAKALLNSIYRYLISADFTPADTLDVSYIRKLFE